MPGISVGHWLNILKMPFGSAIAVEANTSAVKDTRSAIDTVARERVRMLAKRLQRSFSMSLTHFLSLPVEGVRSPTAKLRHERNRLCWLWQEAFLTTH